MGYSLRQETKDLSELFEGECKENDRLLKCISKLEKTLKKTRTHILKQVFDPKNENDIGIILEIDQAVASAKFIIELTTQ